MMISKAVKVAGEVTYEKGYWLKNLTLVYSDVTKGGCEGVAPPLPLLEKSLCLSEF